VSNFIQNDEIFKKGIINLVEIEYLKIVAVACQDNIISLWDFINYKHIFKFNAKHNHLHTIHFFRTFQVLLSAGYDNEIYIYNLHHEYSDYNILGELYGHSTLVTAISGVEDTPMIISCDDRFSIKVFLYIQKLNIF